MALERGTLVVKKQKTKSSIQVQIGNTLFNVPPEEFSGSLGDLDKAHGKEVECERVGGQPKRIREVGGEFLSPVRHVIPGPEAGPSLPEQPQRTPSFHNPYNFIPALPRNALTAASDLADHCPAEQDAFDLERYTGRLRVRMIAKTPILVPDSESEKSDANGHKTYALRTGTDGKPLIPASSVRGMLRSAYEAVTNSRFGRFSATHRDHLAFRMDARDSLKLIPARVESGRICLMTGTSGIGPGGKPKQGDPMYAAWLPRYNQSGQIANHAVRYPDGRLPQHGDAVRCRLALIQHHRWDRNANRHSADFQYWSIRAISRIGEQLIEKPHRTLERRDGQSWHQSLEQTLNVQGWVCVTNANINRKHDERVFFSTINAPRSFPITDAHRSKWRELIQNYQSIHEKDLEKRRSHKQGYDEYLGREPGQTAWSRHVYRKDDCLLTDGTLCYVRLNEDQTEVESLFPVIIARELYDASPWELLHPSLRPATSLSELSPTDRVFGWVKTEAETGPQDKNEPVAVRGLLRLGPVRCESSVEDAVTSFPNMSVPFAILSTPKPQQGRFYIAATQAGEAQRNGLLKEQAGYKIGKSLRGRKVYPHQQLPPRHWDNPAQDRTQQKNAGHYQEYRRPRKEGGEQRDDQNRSILGWVKPGAAFTFDIHVHNLSSVEFGALLWLLHLEQECCFRLGGGKPLGFGSVHLTIETCDVRKGEELRKRYEAWHTEASQADPSKEAMQVFKDAVMQSRYQQFDEVPFIKAFLVACRGYADTLPIHYPRSTPAPSPDGESFKWFVENERVGARYALPDLAHDAGLPMLP